MKKLLASALSCLMLFGVSTLLLTASAAITNPKPMPGQSWTEGLYCESPYDVLDYSDVLKVHEIEVDIDGTASVNNDDSTVTGNLFVMDGWNQSAKILFCPSGWEYENLPSYNFYGMGEITLEFKKDNGAPFFTSAQMEGTQVILTAEGASEFSVDAIRYYDVNGNLLGGSQNEEEKEVNPHVKNSKYSIVDVVTLRKYLLNIKIEPFDSEKFDLNKDKKINIFDLHTLMAILLGLEEEPKDETPDGFSNMTSMEIVQDMKVGWNLGNTLDSIYWENNPTPSQLETAWGNPITTKAMIDEIKKAGFNTVRIPTTWHQFTGQGPDYIIDERWLDRVQEVVDYVIDNDMYCILNTHHEGSWLKPLPENETMLVDRISKVWAQIADRFKDYDERLIFEGLNEPRTEGSAKEWSGGTPEEREVINKLLEAFVKTVRSSGGNNQYRHLMVTPYAAGMYDSLQGFKIPDDDRIIVSIHNYFPYNFALNTSGTSEWGTAAEYSDVSAMFDTLYNKFVSKGIPVVMGECGALNKNNEAIRAAWAEHFFAEAKKRKITCIWWDNNLFTSSGENFGIFRRQTLSWEYPQILEAIMRGVDVNA